MKGILPTLDSAKAQARDLRAALAADGRDISHGQALDLIARSHGLHDWNTLHAAIGNRPRPPVAVGQLVQGRFLNQPFLGEVIGLRELSEGRYEVEMQLDQPVDVVTFDSFSNFRSRIRAVVGPNGISTERTSDGQPQMRLTL